MKKYFIVILFCSFFITTAFSSFAQKIYFSDHSNKWMTYFWYSQGASNGQAVYYKYAYTDSVVNENGHTYSVLNKGNTPLMLVREEGNKVYIRPLVSDFCALQLTNADEFLYFNYDLQVGDTLKMPLVGTGTSELYSAHTVESIDSTEVDGIWYKVFNMKVTGGYTGGYSVTEGLGVVHGQGPLIAAYSLSYTGALVCFQNNGTTPLPDLSNCEALNISGKELMDAEVSIIPNPATHNILIQYKGQSKLRFRLNIAGISGRNIMQTDFDREIKVDVHYFPAGLYFVNISNGKGQQSVKKLVVRH